MRVLSNYKFKNDREIRLVLFTAREKQKRGFPECDDFGLEFIIGDDISCFALRADEVLLISSILSRGLYRGVHGFHLSALTGYDGFDTFSKSKHKKKNARG